MRLGLGIGLGFCKPVYVPPGEDEEPEEPEE